MTSLLMRQLKKRREGDSLREGCAVLSGISGIICNLILSAAKFTVGLLSGSVSITTDGFNNFSDAAVNIVTIAGVKLSRKPVDREHPFGHGRIEYIAALIVAFSIFTVSFELLRESVGKIISPEALSFSPFYVVILSLAICVKLWMAFLNHRLYKLSGSVGLKAVRQDSVNDCVATSATIAALLCARLFGIMWLDGVIGALVAVFVFFSGIGILKDILDPLLGQAPSRETTCRIEELIINNENILGVHDIIVHNYGVNNVLASAHAEVPSTLDLVTVHTLVDGIEHKIKNELNINITIHIDPVVVHDAETLKYKTIASKIIFGYNREYSFHDFRLSDENGKKVMSLDIVIPFEEKDTEKVRSELISLLRNACPEVECDVTVEHSFT